PGKPPADQQEPDDAQNEIRRTHLDALPSGTAAFLIYHDALHHALAAAWSVPTVPRRRPSSVMVSSRMATVRSHSSRVITNGGQSWVVGSFRLSLRRIRPRSRI